MKPEYTISRIAFCFSDFHTNLSSTLQHILSIWIYTGAILTCRCSAAVNTYILNQKQVKAFFISALYPIGSEIFCTSTCYVRKHVSTSVETSFRLNGSPLLASS